MKRSVITLLIVLLATTGFAQFTMGPKAILNFSKFSLNTEVMKSNRKPGFDAGVFMRIDMDRFYLQPEALYSFRSTDVTEIQRQLQDDIFSSSIDAPLMLGYKLIEEDAANFRVFAGPCFSFVLHDNFKDSFRSAQFNFAGQVGFGVDIAMLTLDFRYEYTFTRTAEDKTTDEYLRFNTFLIGLGWKIF